ncbi:hypothetical protein TNCV_2492281 [Trichonephila clavipes]|nr:hypothetical protein TNCV_2492281 [Trichonephila clavipes]
MVKKDTSQNHLKWELNILEKGENSTAEEKKFRMLPMDGVVIGETKVDSVTRAILNRITTSLARVAH